MSKVRDRNWSKCVVCNVVDEMNGRTKRRFYRFPRETDRCRAWIRAIGIRSLVYMPLSELYQQVVCDAHFPPQCFSPRGHRMHKVTLPTISPYPSLSDSIMSFWPKSTMRVQPPTKGEAVSGQSKKTKVNRTNHNELFIDFNQPLMTCLETIKHNELHHVKKPAGISNTISVPLMTYSSSLEQGTIFAAPEPKNIDFSKLPILDLQYDDEMTPVESDNTENKDYQDVVNMKTPIQCKNKKHRDVATNNKVFYGLGTKIYPKKITTSNKTIKSPNNKQSEIICNNKNTMHYLLSTSQFDKSKIIRQYKPSKKFMNRKVPNSELQDVTNTELLNKSEEPGPIKEEDSVIELPSEDNLSDTSDITCTNLIIDQTIETKDSNDEPESPYTQDDYINKAFDVPLAQCITTVQINKHQSKKMPVTKIDVNIPLMRCVDIVDSIDETK